MESLIMGLVALMVGIISLGFFLRPQKILGKLKKGNKVSNEHKYIKIQRILNYIYGSIYFLFGVLLLSSIITVHICLYLFLVSIVVDKIVDFMISKKYVKPNMY